MKVSAIVLAAMLGYSLNAAAQVQPKAAEKPKNGSETPGPKEKVKTKKPGAKNKIIYRDTSNVIKERKMRDPNYCPGCGMG